MPRYQLCIGPAFPSIFVLLDRYIQQRFFHDQHHLIQSIGCEFVFLILLVGELVTTQHLLSQFGFFQTAKTLLLAALSRVTC